MDLEQLRAFLHTAHLGSFSAAAQALGLTQPGISRQVQQLERELGFALVNREQRPVKLTPAGEEFLVRAEAVLADLDATIQRLRKTDAQVSGPLLVAASTIPGEFIVPGLLARFTAQHPEVRPSLTVTDSAGVIEEVLARRAEVGFLGAHLTHQHLRLVPFAEDEIMLVVPADHPFAGSGAVDMSDIAGQPLVEREGGSGTLGSLRRLLSEQGLELPAHRVVMVVGTSQAQLTAIEAGVGLGFVSSLALSSRSSLKVASVQINGVKLRRTLYLAHEQGTLSTTAQAFVGFAVP